MKRRKLGRTGLEISELGFGAWAIGGSAYGSTNDRESIAALEYAFDHGINFFDTADIYGNGHSEELIGKVFRKSSRRPGVYIASKVGWDFYHGGTKQNFAPDYIRFACGESLKRLKTDYLDLYQLHNPTLEQIETGKIFDVLDQLKKEGKTRYYGVSIHLSREGAAAVRGGRPDAIQAIYNLLDQRVKSELMPLAAEHEIGLIAREPLYCGLLTGKYNAESEFAKNDHRKRWAREKYLADLKKIERMKSAFDECKVPLKQAAIEFVLAESAVSVVIPGMKTPAHVSDHLRTVDSPKLSPEEIRRIQTLYQEEELFQMGFFRN